MRTKPNRRPPQTRRRARSVAISLFFRRLVIRSPEDFFSAIGQDDIRFLRQIDIWSAALDAPACDRDFVSILQRRLVPAEVFRQRVSSAEFRLPTEHSALLSGDVEDD